jgi:hypothetical protein
MMKFQCALQVYCIMSIECSRQWPMSRRCVLTQLNRFLLSTSKPFRFSLAEYVYDEIAMILRSAPFVHLTLPARKSGVTQRPWRSRRELRSFIRRPSFPIAPCICSFPKYRYVFLSNSSCRGANVQTLRNPTVDDPTMLRALRSHIQRIILIFWYQFRWSIIKKKRNRKYTQTNRAGSHGVQFTCTFIGGKVIQM